MYVLDILLLLYKKLVLSPMYGHCVVGLYTVCAMCSRACFAAERVCDIKSCTVGAGGM